MILPGSVQERARTGNSYQTSSANQGNLESFISFEATSSIFILKAMTFWVNQLLLPPCRSKRTSPIWNPKPSKHGFQGVLTLQTLSEILAHRRAGSGKASGSRFPWTVWCFGKTSLRCQHGRSRVSLVLRRRRGIRHLEGFGFLCHLGQDCACSVGQMRGAWLNTDQLLLSPSLPD